MVKVITLDDREIAALENIFDVALRQQGLGALDVIAHFIVKLKNAQPYKSPRARKAKSNKG